MIKRIFEWREDQELGGEGWILQNQPTFNASSGLGIAHDVLEHVTDRFSAITNEVIAAGAYMHVRVNGGLLTEGWAHTTPRKAIGNTLGTLLENLDQAQHGDKSIRIDQAPETRPVCDRYAPYDVEAEFQASVVEAVRYANANYASEEPEPYYKEGSDTANMLHWLRVGYRAAKRRYPKSDSYDLLSLFKRLARRVNEEVGDGEDGNLLIVRVCPRSHDIRIEQAYSRS